MYRLARDVTWPDRGTFGVNWGFLSCSPNIPLGPTFPWPPLLLWLRSVITVLRFLCVRLLKIVLLLPLALIISDKSENKLFFFLNSNSLKELKIALPDFIMRSTPDTKVFPEFQEAIKKQVQEQEGSLHNSEAIKQQIHQNSCCECHLPYVVALEACM